MEKDNWKRLNSDHPYPVVSIIAHDSKFRFPIMFRSDKVRSARLRWSLPTGLCDSGIQFHEQVERELSEELGLSVVPNSIVVNDVYDSIIDGYHWMMICLRVEVETLSTMVNKEPEKHSDLQIIDPSLHDLDSVKSLICPIDEYQMSEILEFVLESRRTLGIKP